MAIRPVLIMAGGTGGHVYPALAIAEYLRKKGAQLYWLGTSKGLESRVVPQNNFPLFTINVSGLRGTNIFRWILAPFAVLIAIAHALKIMINIIVKDKQKKFLGKQVYNNTENKFEFNEYEIQIENQIITKMIDEIIIFLSERR